MQITQLRPSFVCRQGVLVGHWLTAAVVLAAVSGQ